MNIFCTLFDSNYLSRGLAMYESLARHSSGFHLYVFAFDDTCEEVLRRMALPSMTVVGLREFEDSELLQVKPSRSRAEYCWTCSSSTILYVLEKYDVAECTYVDADLYFYSDPKVLVDELGSDSILISEHRFTPEYDRSKTAGKYCVQFMVFRNDARGAEALRWWRNACLDWCYARFEDGKFGDQKYLDDWTARFQGVHVLKHLGGGVAPWNIQQYRFESRFGKLVGIEKSTGTEFDLVFYHYHELKFYDDGYLDLGNYRFPAEARCLLYVPYIEHLNRIKAKLQEADATFDPHGSRRRNAGISGFAEQMQRRIKGSYNVVVSEKYLDTGTKCGSR